MNYLEALLELSGNNPVVRVARIGRPHGIRGEVTVELFTDSPETRFAEGQMLRLKTPHGNQPAFDSLTVTRARWNKHILLLKFKEFSDRNTAESLRDAELYAPREDPLDAEGWYADQLIGLAVYLGSFASPQVGEVIDLITGQAQDLLEIRLSDGRKVLVPFVEEIVPEIHGDQGVVITPPAGLLELNQD